MYQVERGKNLLRALFSAELSNVDIFCEDLKEMMVSGNMGESLFVTQLLLREALNNAVIHGCENNSRKRVESVVEWNDAFILVTVADDGSGFDWNKTCMKGSDAECDSGRGLPIMKQYARDVSFNEKGNRLSLKIAMPVRKEPPARQT